MADAPQNQFKNRKRERPAIFKTRAGQEYRRNVSISIANRAGGNFVQVPAGTVFGRYEPENLWYPIGYDHAQSAVSGGNDVEVAMVDQFRLGDMVGLPRSVSDGADRFRKVVGVDRDAGTITLDGSAFSLSEGDALECDRTRSFDEVQDGGTTTGTVVTVADASLFDVGDRLDIGPAANDLIFSIADGSYSGAFSISLQVRTEDGELLADVDAEHDANAEDDNAIATELASQIDDALSNSDAGNLGSASATGGAPSEVTVTIDDPTHEVSYTYSDQAGEISASADDSTSAEVVGVDEGANELTLDRTVTVSNGELIVSDPDGDYRISERTVDTIETDYEPSNVLVPTNDHGIVQEDAVLGLTPNAKKQLEEHIRFTDV